MNWVTAILGIGALGSPISLVILLRQRWRKGEGEITLDKAQESEVVNRAAAINQTRELEREQHWQKKLDDQERKFHGELGELRGEMRELRLESDTLKLFIHRHMPWDWEAVRKMTLAGIEHTDPPSLVYLKGEQEPHDEKH